MPVPLDRQRHYPVVTDTAGRDQPGALLLHPLSIVAVGLLVLNDHVLKDRWGNTLTGKLSDVAGVFVFPLLVLSAVRLLGPLRPGIGMEAKTVRAVVVLTAAGFAAVKLVGPVGDAYASTIGVVRWIASAGWFELGPIEVVRDPTDVLVLPVLIGSYLVARRTLGQTLLG